MSILFINVYVGFPGGSVVKNHLPMQETQETWVGCLGHEDRLEKEMATHSSVPAWEIARTEEPGGLRGVRELDMTQRLSTHTHPYRCHCDSYSYIIHMEVYM